MTIKALRDMNKFVPSKLSGFQGRSRLRFACLKIGKFKQDQVQIEKMKKRSKKQKRKINLLERDNYRCGIHLGGCGKKITLEETTVDHIIPQNILKYDEKHKQRIKFLKKFYKNRTRESLAGGLLNLQPMCSDCNNVKKRGNFPPNDIIKRCSNECCNFIYIKLKDKWYFVVAYHLLKEDLLKQKQDRAETVYYTFHLIDVSFKDKNGVKSENCYILLGKSKNKNLIYERNQMGGLILEYNMIINNQRYSRKKILGAINGFYGENKNEKDIESSIVNSQLNLEEYYQNTIKNCNKNIALDVNDSQSYMNRGFSKLNLGDYIGAIEDFNKNIELNPNNANAYSNRGLAKGHLGQHEESILDFDKSIKLNPNNANAYSNRGIAKGHLGQHEESILDFNKSIKLNPNNANAYSNRGIAKGHLGQHEESILDLDKSIELNPNDANAYSNRGLAKGHLGQYEESVLNFDKSIELNSDDANAYNNRGFSKLKLGDHRGAIEDFNRAISLDTNNEIFLRNREIANSSLINKNAEL